MEYRWASAPFALGGLCGCGVIFLWYATCGILSLGEQVMLSPNPFCDPYTQGAMALQQRDFDTAMPWLNRAIAVNPNDADAYASRGDVYYTTGRSEQALGDYTKAIDLDPDQEATTYTSRAWLLARLDRDLDQALADVNRALRVLPDRQDYLDTPPVP